MALSNSNFDGILAALIPQWESSNFASLFVHHNAFWMKMLMSGRIQTGGFGTKLVEPVMFPTTTGPQVERVSDALADATTSVMTGYTAAEYIPAEYRMDWAVKNYELAQFGSDTEKVSWVEAHMQNASERFFNYLEVDFWGNEDGANSAGSRTTLASIKTFLNGGTTAATDGGALPAADASQSLAPFTTTISTTAITLVGNIQRSAVGGAYWCTPLIRPASSTALSAQVMSKTYSLAVCGAIHPNVMVVHRDLFDVLQNLASIGGSNGGQFQNGSRLADLGFDAIKFRGADVITDDKCSTAGYIDRTTTVSNYNIFAINTDYLALKMREKKPNFRRVDDPREIRRYVGAMMLQLTASNLGRVHARHVNITAP